MEIVAHQNVFLLFPEFTPWQVVMQTDSDGTNIIKKINKAILKNEHHIVFRKT